MKTSSGTPLLLAATFLGIVVLAWYVSQKAGLWSSSSSGGRGRYARIVEVRDPIREPGLSYSRLRGRISNMRSRLAERYQRATPNERRRVLAAAGDSLLDAINGWICPYWYGTDWDFNGTTETPQQGKIACGYFVTTVLRDAGLRLEREWLAQQASETMIKSLVGGEYIRRFSKATLPDFVAAVKQWGKGVYIVGLDKHTGLLIHTGDDLYFVHSTYISPGTVVKERAIESLALGVSRYRVVGKISADKGALLRWIRNEETSTRQM